MWTSAPRRWSNQSGFASLPVRTPPLRTSTPALDLQRSVGTSGTKTSLVPAHGEAFRLLTAASEQELKVANERFDVVKRHMEGEVAPAAVPARTLRSWLARYRLATEKYGNGYVGLLPKTGGSRQPHPPPT